MSRAVRNDWYGAKNASAQPSVQTAKFDVSFASLMVVAWVLLAQARVGLLEEVIQRRRIPLGPLPKICLDFRPKGFTSEGGKILRHNVVVLHQWTLRGAKPRLGYLGGGQHRTYSKTRGKWDSRKF